MTSRFLNKLFLLLFISSVLPQLSLGASSPNAESAPKEQNKKMLTNSSSMESCGSPVTLSISGLLREKEPGKEVIDTLALILRNGEEAWNSRITPP